MSTDGFQNDMRNNALQMASVEQRKADENVLRLVEEQKVGSINIMFMLLFPSQLLLCFLFHIVPCKLGCYICREKRRKL